jgi:hypothetical protein
MFNVFARSLVYITVLAFFLAQNSFALETASLDGQTSGGGDDVLNETMSDIGTVALVGAAGAIIGLSTLSFKEYPTQHFKNIITGGAIGLVIGVGMVTFNKANQYSENFKEASITFPTADRYVWHVESFNGHETYRKSTFSIKQIVYNF